jgi:hypothetical protein
VLCDCEQVHSLIINYLSIQTYVLCDCEQVFHSVVRSGPVALNACLALNSKAANPGDQNLVKYIWFLAAWRKSSEDIMAMNFMTRDRPQPSGTVGYDANITNNDIIPPDGSDGNPIFTHYSKNKNSVKLLKKGELKVENTSFFRQYTFVQAGYWAVTTSGKHKHSGQAAIDVYWGPGFNLDVPVSVTSLDAAFVAEKRLSILKGLKVTTPVNPISGADSSFPMFTPKTGDSTPFAPSAKPGARLNTPRRRTSVREIAEGEEESAAAYAEDKRTFDQQQHAFDDELSAHSFATQSNLDSLVDQQLKYFVAKLEKSRIELQRLLLYNLRYVLAPEFLKIIMDYLRKMSAGFNVTGVATSGLSWKQAYDRIIMYSVEANSAMGTCLDAATVVRLDREDLAAWAVRVNSIEGAFTKEMLGGGSVVLQDEHGDYTPCNVLRDIFYRCFSQQLTRDEQNLLSGTLNLDQAERRAMARIRAEADGSQPPVAPFLLKDHAHINAYRNGVHDAIQQRDPHRGGTGKRATNAQPDAPRKEKKYNCEMHGANTSHDTADCNKMKEEKSALKAAKGGKDKWPKSKGDSTAPKAAKGKDLSTIQCYHCQGMGHYANDCKKSKVERSTNLTFNPNGEKRGYHDPGGAFIPLYKLLDHGVVDGPQAARAVMTVVADQANKDRYCAPDLFTAEQRGEQLARLAAYCEMPEPQEPAQTNSIELNQHGRGCGSVLSESSVNGPGGILPYSQSTSVVVQCLALGPVMSGTTSANHNFENETRTVKDRATLSGEAYEVGADYATLSGEAGGAYVNDKLLKVYVKMVDGTGATRVVQAALDTCSNMTYVVTEFAHDVESCLPVDVDVFGGSSIRRDTQGIAYIVKDSGNVYGVRGYVCAQSGMLPNGCVALLSRHHLNSLHVDLNYHLGKNPDPNDTMHMMEDAVGGTWMSERAVQAKYEARIAKPPKSNTIEAIDISPEVTPDDVVAIKSLITEFKSIFLERAGSPPLMNGPPVKMELKDGAVPYRCKRPTYGAFTSKFHEETYLPKIEDGSWEFADENCEWASRCHLAHKPDGSAEGWIRPCGDYVEVNHRLKKIPHNVHDRELSVEKLGDSKIFIEADFPSAYEMVGLHPESRPILAIWTSLGLIQPTRMTWGPCNAGDYLQSRVDKIVLKQDPFLRERLVNYADDFRVHLKKMSELVPALRAFFEMCNDNKLSLTPRKTRIGYTKTEFLGYDVTEGGKTLAEKNVQPIREMKEPSDKSELRRCLGLMNGASGHIRNYAITAAPLTALTGTLPWNWTKECQQAFDSLKASCLANLAVNSPNWDYPFSVEVDASDDGVGAVLFQMIEDSRRSIRFASTPYKTRKMATRPIYYREAHAIVFGMRKFRLYLLRSRFVTKVLSDHAPLRWIRSAEKGPVSSWIIEHLSETPFEVTYLPGEDNPVADAMSRTPMVAPATLADKGVARVWADILTALGGIAPWLKATVLPWVYAGKNTPEAVRLVQAWRTAKRSNTPLKFTPAGEPEKSEWTLAIVQPAVEVSPLVCRSLFETGKPFACLVSSDLVDWIAIGLGDGFADAPDSEMETLVSTSKKVVVDPEIAQNVGDAGKIAYSTAGLTWVIGNVPEAKSYAAVYTNTRSKSRAGIAPSEGGVEEGGVEENEVKEIIEEHEEMKHSPTTQDKNGSSQQKEKKQNQVEQSPKENDIPIRLDDLRIDTLTSNEWWQSNNTRETWIREQELDQEENGQYVASHEGEIAQALDGLYFMIENGRNQVIVPTPYREPLTKIYHELTVHHSASRKTVSRLKETFYWPTMVTDVKAIIKSCYGCQLSKAEIQEAHQQYRPLEFNKLFEAIGIDIYTMPKSASGMTCILTIIDLLSRFVMFIPLRDHTAFEVCKAILDRVIWVRGVPTYIVHDGASELLGRLATALKDILGIKSIVAWINPTGNAVCERQHRFLGVAFRTLSPKQLRNWPDMTPRLEFAANSSPNDNNAGISAFEMERGSNPRGPVASIFVQPEDISVLEKAGGALGGDLLGAAATFREIAIATSDARRADANFKLNKKGRRVNYVVGDQVVIYLPPSISVEKRLDKDHKGKQHYKHAMQWAGPMDVVEKISASMYKVCDPISKATYKRNVGQLRRYYASAGGEWGLHKDLYKHAQSASSFSAPPREGNAGEEVALHSIIVVEDEGGKALLIGAVTEISETDVTAQALVTETRKLQDAKFKLGYIEDETEFVIMGKPAYHEKAKPYTFRVLKEGVLLQGIALIKTGKKKDCLTKASVSAIESLKKPVQVC